MTDAVPAESAERPAQGARPLSSARQHVDMIDGGGNAEGWGEANIPLERREAARLKALWHYRILDTAPEGVYDDIVLLAAAVCDAPIALVSLLDEDRQWCKARVGVDRQETRRDESFCAHALDHGEDILEVPDAQLDPRFAGNPHVTGEPCFRFYAGAPLVAKGGHVLGAVCVLDRVPRTLTQGQRECLAALARQVIAHIEQRLMLLTDGLTRLPNRGAVLALVESAVARAKRVAGYRFAVLSIDIDRFKTVNDQFGHGVGDAFLCQVSERIDGVIRGNDSVAWARPNNHMAGRMGGDEFVVLLDGVEAVEGVQRVVQRMLDSLSRPYEVGGRVLHSAGSIGIAVPGDRAFDADSILREADIAMYQAKRAGRGMAVVFEPGMEFCGSGGADAGSAG